MGNVQIFVIKSHQNIVAASSRGIKQRETKRRPVLETDRSKMTPGRAPVEKESTKSNPRAVIRKRTRNKSLVEDRARKAQEKHPGGTPEPSKPKRIQETLRATQ